MKISRFHIYTILVILMTALSVPSAAFASDAKKKSSSSSKAEKQFVIVVDAGHGGHDHGAIENGLNEKDINLSVARKVAEKASKRLKNVKVVLTRNDDRFISLQERANIANRNKGDLFMSIHCNSADKSNPNRKSAAGASVYALGPQKDADNLRVAQRENSVIELEDNYNQKYSGFDPSKDESYIIFEMAQKKNLGHSLKFADKAQKELVKTAGRNNRGVKQAGFWVLWATAMPSVLVELDFLCNPEEAKFLGSSAGQDKLADALVNAIDQYVNSYNNPSANNGKTNVQESTNLYAEEVVTDQDAEVSYDGVNTLVTNSGAKTPKRQHMAQSNTRKTTASRKRRSETSKKKSDARTLETESIALKSENSYLAVQDSKPEKVEEKSVPQNTTDKNKKKKKDKKKDKKKKETTQKDVPAKKKSGNSNQKTFVVKNSSSSSNTYIGNTANQGTTVSKSSSGSQAKGNGGKLQARNKTRESVTAADHNSIPASFANSPMEYTIVLLSSPEELKSNDPAFCGLVPSGQFRENGLYKYTYGRSTDRKEIERMLLDVKSKLPEASIVVRMK